ncbi:MAG: TraB/GumN family protein [Catalinimonas sp.]
MATKRTILVSKHVWGIQHEELNTNAITMNHCVSTVLLCTVLLCTLLLGCAATAQPGGTKRPADADAAPGLLWRITGEGLAAPSYLYGTIHAVCADELVVNDATKRAFEATGRVALEIDLDDPATMMTIQQRMATPGGEKMADVLSADDYAFVKAFFADSLGVNLDQVQQMPPMMLTSMVFPKLLDCTPQAYEMVFMSMARAAEKEIVGVETAADQMDAVASVPYAEQAKMLVEMVRNYEESRAQMRALVTAYHTGNLRPVYQMMMETMPNAEAFEEVFLIQRNRNWIPVIGRMAREEPTFFAVGALHLGGETGVIRLLREAGYTVEVMQ